MVKRKPATDLPNLNNFMSLLFKMALQKTIDCKSCFCYFSKFLTVETRLKSFFREEIRGSL